MKTQTAPRSNAITAAARTIATADNCRAVAPAHVVRAALTMGYGTPSKPLSKVLPGLRVTGVKPSAGEWTASVEAMLAGGWLYAGHGGALMWAGKRAA